MSKKAFFGGTIYSVDLDGKEHRYEAMGIDGDKIVALGAKDEVMAALGEGCELVDLKGKMLLPSFSNSHAHYSLRTLSWVGANLLGIIPEVPGDWDRLVEQYLEALDAYIRGDGKDLKIVRGHGPDLMTLMSVRPVRKEELDKVCSDRPVAITSFCCHYLWCNSKALEAAGITKDGPDIPGIIRDEDGEPTGVLQEFPAMDYAAEHIPDYDFTVEQYKEGIKQVCAEHARYGVTLGNDSMPTDNAIKAYVELAESGELEQRVRGSYRARTDKGMEQYDEFKARYDSGADSCGDMYRTGTMKFFNDGNGIEIYQEDEYPEWVVGPDVKGWYGRTVWNTEDLERAFARCRDLGFNIQVHAIGAGSIRETINAFDYAERITKKTGNRDAIIHLNFTNPRDVHRMAELGLSGVVQPYWAGGIFGERAWWGNDVFERVFTFRAFIDAGMRLSGGDDFPVCGITNPLEAMQVGVTRKPTRNQIVRYGLPFTFEDAPSTNPTYLQDKNNVSLREMIQMFTINSAWMEFLEDVTGSLEVGKSADFVILDKDLFKIPAQDIELAKVEATFFKGKAIYQC